jgi:APA family basic amino acid/polyamine antiporter
MQEDKEEFKRELGLMDGTMLVVGSMIGSGIFIVSSDMVRQFGWLIAMGSYRDDYGDRCC